MMKLSILMSEESGNNASRIDNRLMHSDSLEVKKTSKKHGEDGSSSAMEEDLILSLESVRSTGSPVDLAAMSRLLEEDTGGAGARESRPHEEKFVYESKYLKKMSKKERRDVKLDIARGAIFPESTSSRQAERGKMSPKKTKSDGNGDQVPGPSGTTRGVKVKRQETDPDEKSEQKPAKKRNRGGHNKDPEKKTHQIARNTGYGVAIHREDGVDLDGELANLIRRKLVSFIGEEMEKEGSEDKVRFITSGLVAEGFFLVTGRTEVARDWVLGLDFGLVGGHKMKTKRADNIRVTIWLPGPPEEHPENPLRWIQRQNVPRKELRLEEWAVVNKKPGPMGTLLRVSLPKEVEKFLIADRTLSYQACTVQVQVQDVDQGRSEDAHLKKNTQEGTSTQ